MAERLYKKVQKKIKRLTYWGLLLSNMKPPACGCGCLVLSAGTLPLLLLILLPIFLLAPAEDTREGTPTSKQVEIKNWQGKRNKSVVEAALEMAPHIYIGGPNNQAQEYDAGFPMAVINYWNKICPGCEEWAEGNLQCTFFVIGAYGLAGQDLPYMGNAVDYWSGYAGISGWQEIPNGSSDPPIPGDIAVWYGGNYGHVAIVTDVQLPEGNKSGFVQIAQANAPEGSVDTLKLVASGNGLFLQSQPTWGESWGIIGYIRHTVDVS